MKHVLIIFCFVFGFGEFATDLKSQSQDSFVSTFDDLLLDPESYWNGSDLSGGFVSGGGYFENTYNAEWQYWKGFAYSNTTNITSADYSNQYSANTGGGFDGSGTYGVSYVENFSQVDFGAPAALSGVYVTNSALATLVMQTGNEYAKKFGGETGADPDWFKLTISGFDSNLVSTGSVEFMLADYRFEESSLDYIVNQWTWVDLSSLGGVISLSFSLTSSDTGEWGMNTPAYFCIDNLVGEIIESVESFNGCAVKISPNPFSDFVHIEAQNLQTIEIYNTLGSRIYLKSKCGNRERIDLKEFGSGIYFVKIQANNQFITKQIVKQ